VSQHVKAQLKHMLDNLYMKQQVNDFNCNLGARLFWLTFVEKSTQGHRLEGPWPLEFRHASFVHVPHNENPTTALRKTVVSCINHFRSHKVLATPGEFDAIQP
jgi:hypothetical protein